MITLYHRPNDAHADSIQETLDDLVVAYDTVVVPQDQSPPSDVPSLPALRDDGTVITGKNALSRHLSELETLLSDWRRFQSDACYVNDDGSVC